MGGYYMPGLARRERPNPGETEIAICRVAIIRACQLHPYRNDGYVTIQSNLLL